MDSYINIKWSKRASLISHKEKVVYSDVKLPENIRKILSFHATIVVDTFIGKMLKKQ